MKKTIIISNYDDLKNPYYGGGGAYVIHRLAKRLAGSFETVVITGKYPGSKNESVDGVKYKRIGLASASPKIGQVIYYLALFFYFKSHKFDLWMENFTPPFSTNFLQVFSKKPIVGLVHMLVGEDMRRKYKLPFDVIERLGIKTYRYFIVPTESARKKLLHLNPKARVELIPNGIDEVERRVDTKPQNQILFMGRIETNQKGLDLLLESFSRIVPQINTDLIIAGSGLPKDVKRLNEQIDNLGIKDRVKLLGRVTGKRKVNLYSSSLFVVIPSRFETFSMVALESLAYGLPIVTYDIEGLSWMPRGSRIKVKPYDMNALSEAMLRVAREPNLRVKMNQASKRSIKNYEWNNVFRRYDKFINSIL